MNITTAAISDGGLNLLREKIVPFNRRAARWGIEPITVTVDSVEVREWIDEQTGIKKSARTNHVTVTGEVPRINGWSVAARIEFTGAEAGNFVVTAPGVESVDTSWRTVSNICQHCNTSRTRSDLVVIRHEDGREMIVGRNCLADYIRTTNVNGLIDFCDWRGKVGLLTSEAENEFWGNEGGGRVEFHYELETILQAASLCIRKLGWKSAKAADTLGDGEGTTKSDVSYLLHGGETRNSEARRNWEKWVSRHSLYLNDHDAAEAVAAREWLAKVVPGHSDYLHNLCILRELDRVPRSKIGIAVSIIVAAKKAREDEIKRKEQPVIEKKFIGEVKERLRSLPVTVKRVNSMESDFGVKTIITFMSGDCELTWFASGDRTEEYAPGDEFLVDATVKEHKDHERYGKSTIVNRVAKKAVAA